MFVNINNLNKNTMIYIAIEKEDGSPIAASMTLEGLNTELNDYFGVGKNTTVLENIEDINKYAEHPDILEFVYTYDCEPYIKGEGRYKEVVYIYCVEIS